jgi:hypothetical protein
MQNYKKRLHDLQNRREILISANSIYHYTQSGNKKTTKYFKTMVEIRRQIATCCNALSKENNPIREFLKSTSGLNGSQILMLNSK